MREHINTLELEYAERDNDVQIAIDELLKKETLPICLEKIETESLFDQMAIVTISTVGCISTPSGPWC